MDPLTIFLAVNGIYGQIQVVRKKSRGFVQLILGQIVWLIWEGRHFALTWPLMIGTVSYLATYIWGWRTWRATPAVETEDRPPPCPFDHEDLLEGWGEGTPCRCQPHHAGQAPGCPEGCPTHNHGGEDVPEGALGGQATDEELADGDRCPACPCAIGSECEACARECAR